MAGRGEIARVLDAYLGKAGRPGGPMVRHGEGSHGGHIIGHTTSGKPIYLKHHAGDPENSHFTARDHADAYRVHMAHASHHLDTRDKLRGKWGRARGAKKVAYGLQEEDADKMLNYHEWQAGEHRRLAGIE